MPFHPRLSFVAYLRDGQRFPKQELRSRKDLPEVRIPAKDLFLHGGNGIAAFPEVPGRRDITKAAVAVLDPGNPAVTVPEIVQPDAIGREIQTHMVLYAHEIVEPVGSVLGEPAPPFDVQVTALSKSRTAQPGIQRSAAGADRRQLPVELHLRYFHRLVQVYAGATGNSRKCGVEFIPADPEAAQRKVMGNGLA